MFVCDKRDRAITCMLCRDLHSALMFSGFYKKICLKESDGCEKLFQTNLLSWLSHKVCRLLSSPVLLRKFTNIPAAPSASWHREPRSRNNWNTL